MKAPRTRILIVDDNEFDQLLLRRTLEHSGYSITIAASGKQALDLLDDLQPDLILMDVEMPGMDGKQAAARLRKRSRHRYIPIIFITGHAASDSMLASCLASGGDDFLTKPIRPLVLNAKLQSMLRARQQYQELAAQHLRVQDKLEELELEYESTERMLDYLLDTVNCCPGNLRYLKTARSPVDGSLLTSSLNPQHQQYILLGNCTGQGLNAGLGLLPVIELFNQSCAADTPLSELVLQLNQTLYTRTPIEFFMSAIIIKFDPVQQRLDIWNGGMPDVYVYDEQRGLTDTVASTNQPLGINPNGEFSPDCRQLTVTPDSRLLFYSDGLLETDAHDTGFNTSNIKATINQSHHDGQAYEQLLTSLLELRTHHPHADKICLVELHCNPVLLADSARSKHRQQHL